MRRDDLVELHFITPFDNIVSILQGGLRSHALSQEIPHRSVSSEIVQSKRASKAIPLGRPLHDYVNLYVCGRNPMLYRLKFTCGYSELCVLSISPEVLDQPGAIVCDCNASSEYARFAPAPEGLEIVDKELVFARNWNHPDPIEKFRHVSIKCAEVLIPDRVDAKYISKAYVSCQESKLALESRLRAAGLNLDVVVDTYLFFK